MVHGSSALFSPVSIGGLQLRNRLVMAPMGSNFGNAEGFPGQNMVNHVEARARGGVGMVIVEHTMVDLHHGRVIVNQFSIDHDRYIPAWAPVAEAIRRYGAAAVIQLGDFGRRSRLRIGKLVSSSMPRGGHQDFYGYMLSKDEVSESVEAFAQAARRAQQAGFDAVEIHATHGYLINQFLSGALNTRDDEYGGGLEGRTRYLLEIVAAIKSLLGHGFPLLVRLTAEEPELPGGLTIEETAQIAGILEKAGVDAIDLSDLDASKTLVPPYAVTLPPGHALKYGPVVKREVSVPVLVAGKINSLDMAEGAVQGGMADLVSLARPLVCDPELPRKWREGKAEGVRPCIYCMRCIDTIIYQEREMRCSVNPALGHEPEFEPKPAPQQKRVVVVGGGPAGMEAAAMAARRGHHVSLWEREGSLGGMLLAAVVPPRKERIARLTEYLIRELNELAVDIELGGEVTAEAVAAAQPDVVVLAVGGEPVLPQVPGLGRHNTVRAVELLLGRADAGKRVVVIGAERVGCETAEYLAERGHRVVLVRRGPRIGVSLPARDRRMLLESLRERDVTMLAGVDYRELTPRGLVVTHGGQTHLLEADTVVIAAGATPRRELYTALMGRIPEVHLIGDCVRVRTIQEALEDAQRLTVAV